MCLVEEFDGPGADADDEDADWIVILFACGCTRVANGRGVANARGNCPTLLFACSWLCMLVVRFCYELEDLGGTAVAWYC